MIDPYQRYQKQLSLIDLYPTPEDGTCACGCHTPLSGRQTRWCDPDHVKIPLENYSIIKGDTQVIRSILFEQEEGYCRKCGVFDEHWEADHIVSVCEGGGGCGIEGFQTLCQVCHKVKTKLLYLKNPIS